MRRSLLTVTALLALAAFSLRSEADLLLTGVGAVAPSYVGVGDVQSGFTFFYGVEAYNGAHANSNAMIVCTPSDTQCDQLSYSAGIVKLGTNTSGCNNSTTQCTIKTWDDSSGNGINVTQATIASRALYTINCVASILPCATGNNAATYPQTLGAAITTDLSSSTVSERTSGSSFNWLWTNSGQRPAVGWGNTTATLNSIQGNNSIGSASAPNNTLTSVQFVQQGNSGTTGNIYVNGTGTVITQNALASTGTAMIFMSANAVNFLNGFLTEFGVYPSPFTNPIETSVCHNQRTRYSIAGATC